MSQFRLDIRPDRDVVQGPIIIGEATPIVQTRKAIFTCEGAPQALRQLGVDAAIRDKILATFEDGKERVLNISLHDAAMQEAGFTLVDHRTGNPDGRMP